MRGSLGRSWSGNSQEWGKYKHFINIMESRFFASPSSRLGWKVAIQSRMFDIFAACFIWSSLNNLLTLSRLVLIRYCDTWYLQGFEYMMIQYVIRLCEEDPTSVGFMIQNYDRLSFDRLSLIGFYWHPNLSDKIRIINAGTILVLIFG